MNVTERALRYLLDALFPVRCVSCQRYGSLLCGACLASLTFPRGLTCPECGTPQALGSWCEPCQAKQPGAQALSGLWPVGSYGNPILRQAVHGLKYDGLIGLVPELAKLMAALLEHFQLPPRWHEVPVSQWVLVPVPLHPRKERMRGCNQARLLARSLSHSTGLAIQELLIRTRSTEPQSKQDAGERARNIANAFAVSRSVSPVAATYILVDDVYTSGATMHECARMLLAAGAREVWGLVVAKG